MRHLLLAASMMAVACGGSNGPGSNAPLASSSVPSQSRRLAIVEKGADKTCTDADPCSSVRAPGETQVDCEKVWAGQSLRDRFPGGAGFVCTFAR